MNFGAIGSERKTYKQVIKQKELDNTNIGNGSNDKDISIKKSELKYVENVPIAFEDVKFLHPSLLLPFFFDEIPTCGSKFIDLCIQLNEVQEHIDDYLLANKINDVNLSQMIDDCEQSLQEDFDDFYRHKYRSKILLKKFKSKKCKYHEAGFCLHGDNCAYIH